MDIQIASYSFRQEMVSKYQEKKVETIHKTLLLQQQMLHESRVQRHINKLAALKQDRSSLANSDFNLNLFVESKLDADRTNHDKFLGKWFRRPD